MIDIPPELRIRASVRPGSVYYFSEATFSSTDPHYFIVLNHSPTVDRILLLVCPSPQSEKVRRRRRHLPQETLVEIGKHEYPVFTVDSIVDCNTVILKSIDELIAKLSQGVLQVKPEMSMTLVQRLRFAVQASPMVSGEDKALLG